MTKNKRNNTPISHDPEKHGFKRSYCRIVMYDNLNSGGVIFGGQLVAWIDEGSVIFACSEMNARNVVTKKLSELVFNQPGRLGDVLEIWCKVLKRGTTSLTVEALVLRRTFLDDSSARRKANKSGPEICRCTQVFVSVDGDGRPKSWHRI